MINFKKIFISVLIFLILILLLVIIFTSKVMNNDKEIDELLEANKELLDVNSVVASNLRTIDSSDTIIGTLGSKVEIIIYEDLSDFYSVKSNETLTLIKEKFSSDIIIAFRPYVDKSFPLSYPAYSLAECAKEQNKFFEMRKIILEKVNEGQLNENSFSEYAVNLGMDVEAMNKCLADRKYYSKIEALSREAEDFGVYGSPVFFVNKEMVVGARSFDDVINGGGEKLPGLRSIVARHLGIDELESNLPEEAVCAMDVKECADGSYVGRDSKNNCEFFPCLDDESMVCTMDAKICPDGSSVGRDAKNNCEFFPCLVRE
ncbi:MAG: thioredoxin domain-containing protein [Candidatus Colwellbacteria bacterium]|nr:thioredoxin domain-containing protein [Candidatus Colwellbacteria bacterium]